MAVLKVGGSSVGKISVIQPYDETLGYPTIDYRPDLQTWTRPSDWIDMPVISSGDEKAAILMFMESGVPLEIRIYARGPYINGGYPIDSTISWGDGTSGVINGRSTNSSHSDYINWQEHTYNYEDLPVESEFIYNNRTCRQFIVEVDNTVSGVSHMNLSQLTMTNYNGRNGYARNYQSSNALEYKVASETCTDLYLGRSIEDSVQSNVESVELMGSMQLITAYRQFRSMQNLQNVSFPTGLYSSANGDFREMFYDCRKLNYLPFFDMSNATDLNNTFGLCTTVQSIPNYNTASVTGWRSTFQNCLALNEIPDLDYSAGTDFGSTFYNMRSIKTIPSGADFSSATYVAGMFNRCEFLEAVPNNFFEQFENTVTYSDSMFYECRSLKKLPRIHLPKTTSMREFARNCHSLQELHLGDLSSVRHETRTDYEFFYSFAGCTQVKKIQIDYPDRFNARSYNGMFSALYSLEEAPYFDTSSGVVLTNLYAGCVNLKKVPTYDYSSCQYIDGIHSSNRSLRKHGGFNTFNNKIINAHFAFDSCWELREFPSGFCVDFNSCPSYAHRMFYQCHAIYEIPDVNISGATSTSTNQQIFHNMANIRKIGNITIGSGTNLRNAFNSTGRLTYFPELDVSEAYDTAGMFYRCGSLARCDITGINKTISFYDNHLGSGAITDIINNLESGVTGQTIDFRLNYGAAQLHSDTIGIATSKGWTILTS